MEAMKVNTIMEQLDKSNGNGHHRRNSINHFAPIYESENDEGTQHRTQHNTSRILLCVKDKGRKNKGGQRTSNEKGVNDQENKATTEVYDLNSDKELNGDFGTAENDDDSGNDNK